MRTNYGQGPSVSYIRDIATRFWENVISIIQTTLNQTHNTMPSIPDPHGDSSWLSCCCPELWRSCSVCSVGLMDSSLSLVGSGVGAGQLKAIDLGLDGSWIGQLASKVHGEGNSLS